MRNLLALLGAVVVAFAIAGYFLDWYNIRTTIDGEGHRHQVIDIDPPKVAHDLPVLAKEGKEVVNHLVEKNGQPGQAPAPTPQTSPTPSAPNAVVVKPSDLLKQSDLTTTVNGNLP